jgi:putative ABC transport system substrate-binding protein
MRRREFISLLGGAAGWPVAARGQLAAMPVVGFLGSESPALFARPLRLFSQALSETGYVEGQNVTIEYRWAEGKNDRLPAMAADLVRRQVNVIVAPQSTPAALAAQAATATIPIVIFTAGDPVALRLVASLNRPGGNITGTTSLGRELVGKRLALMHELTPTAALTALLVNPSNPALAESTTREAQAAARILGRKLHILNASTESDFDAIFATLVKLKVGALVIGIDSFFTGRREHLARLTLRYRVPAIYQYRDFATAGGLMSYGGSLNEPYRLVGLYTGLILKGQKPADLPIQQATKIELIINLKTARELDVTMPPTLLVRADEVIE